MKEAAQAGHPHAGLAAEPGTRSTAFGAAGVGTGLTLSATVGLTVTGRLEGASLLPSGGAVTEAVVLSLADGLVGLVLTRGRRDPR